MSSSSKLEQRLETLPPARLRGMRRGIEKESLRSQADGKLALTPHPAALGSALTHPHITTDFSESQLELITGAHADVRSLPGRAARDPPVHLPRAQGGRRRTDVGVEHALRPAVGRDHSDRALRHVERGPRQERLPHGPVAPLRAAHADDLGHPLQLVAAAAGQRAVLRADPQLPPPCLPAALPVRRLAGGVRKLCRGPAAPAAARSASTPCTCRTAPRCAWAGSATRARRRLRCR